MDRLARRIELGPSLSVSLFLFFFFFILGFFLARAWLRNNSAKVFFCGQLTTFPAHSTIYGKQRLCFSCSSPAPTGNCELPSMVLQFVDDHLITKLPAHKHPLSEPRRSFMITFGNGDDLHKFSNAFFGSTDTEWSKTKAVSWQLPLDLVFMLRKRWGRRKGREEGRGDRKNRSGIQRLLEAKVGICWRGYDQPKSPHFTMIMLYCKLRYC